MSKFLKPRLGRGLSSLISVSDLPVELEVPPAAVDAAVLDAAEARLALAPDSTQRAAAPRELRKSALLELPIGAISANPHQPRRRMNEASILELAASLKVNGLIQPVVVRKSGERYELIAGERRWRAAQVAGFVTIPVILREVDEFAQAQMALVENIQREDLNPIDRANAYRSLIAQLGLTQAELAQRLGEDRSSIANYLRLLELSDAVQKSVIDGRLSLGHGKLLASVPDILEQDQIAQLVIAQGLSVRNLERVIEERRQGAPSQSGSTPVSAHLVDLEKNLSRQLGIRVQIRSAGQSKTKGRLICHFANLDQFDELMGRLGLTAQ